MIDRSIGTLLKKNVKNYGMFIALMAVFIFFALATAGTFITPRNLSNLFDQTGYVAVLAIGMTLVLIIRQIDLSVGYACGFIGAIAALLMKNFPGIPVLEKIPANAGTPFSPLLEKISHCSVFKFLTSLKTSAPS